MLWRSGGREPEQGKLFKGVGEVVENARCNVQSIIRVTCGVVQAYQRCGRIAVGAHCRRLHLPENIKCSREITLTSKVPKEQIVGRDIDGVLAGGG